MSDPIDWALLGKQAQKRADDEAVEKERSAERGRQENLAKAAFRAKAAAALQDIRNTCERNCGEYNANVSSPGHRLAVTSATNGFLISKGNGIVRASFQLDSLRSQHLILSRENSMTPRNLHTYKLDALEGDGKVCFGTIGVDFVISDNVKLATDACRWVIETQEEAHK
jgi:hypothetical protein